MKIIVCVKVVLDPEAPASLFKVDSEAKKVIPPKGTPPVLNPFDENALEAALKLKESKGGSITVISMGKNLPKPVIRKSLATGADNLVLLEDGAFEELDSYTTAYVLATAIRKIGGYDLILCGREAADTDAGQVGLGIAEMLGIPSVNLASKIEAGEKGLKVERVSADGYETLEIPLPALITVSSEIGTLRTASITGIMAAQKKPLTTWNARELGIIQPQAKKISLHQLFQPVRETKCEMITGASPEEAAANLALKLKQEKKLPV
jgi:electron transfer flavoprotein beta subunit